MSVGGSIRPAQVAGILVGERALLSQRSVSPFLWRAEVAKLDAVPGSMLRDVGRDGAPLLDAGQALGILEKSTRGGSPSAGRAMRAALAEGAWLRDGGDLVPVQPDALRQALDGVAAVAARADRERVDLAPRIGRVARIAAAAGVTAGVGLLGQGLVRRGLGAPGDAGDLEPGAAAGAAANAAAAAVQDPDRAASVRARVADLAGNQVGVVDTDGEGKLSREVASYMDSSEGADKTVHREWQGDFVGWIWREAGVPLGKDAIGAGDVSSLVDWASDMGKWKAGAPARLPDPKVEVGTLVVLAAEPGGDPSDVGIVVRADDRQLELVQGNRATTSSVGDSEVGGVRRVTIHRSDPVILGSIDPLAAGKVVATPVAKPTAAPAPGVPAGTPVRGSAPPESSLDAPDAAQMEAVIDWSAAQYARDPEHAKMLGTLMRNVVSQESGFRINALNLWDRAAWDMHTPSTGPFQFLRGTFFELQPKAQRDNPEAWAKVGGVSRTDWRQQVLTAAWALAQPPSEAGKASGNWSKQHGQYWSRWYSIKDLRAKGQDPRTSDGWKAVLQTNAATIAAPVEQVTTYPKGWKARGKALSPEELRQIVATGETYAIPRPPG